MRSHTENSACEYVVQRKRVLPTSVCESRGSRIRLKKHKKHIHRNRERILTSQTNSGSVLFRFETDIIIITIECRCDLEYKVSLGTKFK